MLLALLFHRVSILLLSVFLKFFKLFVLFLCLYTFLFLSQGSCGDKQPDDYAD